MDISLMNLADMVAIRLGEYPDRLLPEGRYAVGLEEMCSKIVLPIAVRLTESFRLEALDCVKDMTGLMKETADYGNDGYVECELPDDFLRLRRVMLAGWSRPAVSATTTDDGTAGGLSAALDKSAPQWMQRESARVSAVALPPLSVDAKRRLRLRPLIAAGIEEGVYIPLPKIEDGWLTDVSSTLIEALVEEMADIIGGR